MSKIGEFRMYEATSYLVNNRIWLTCLDILHALSLLSTIAGVVAVIIAVLNFEKSIQDKQEEQKNAKINTSMFLLHTFAKTIIPEMGDLRVKCKDQYNSLLNIILNEANKSLSKKKMPKIDIDTLKEGLDKSARKRLITASKTFVPETMQVFNDLEEVTAYINQGLVDENLVYGPTHKVFIDFVKEFIVAIDQVSKEDPDVPYTNVRAVYIKWSKRWKNENIDKEIVQLQNKKENER